jgi:hypothetical protein
MIILAWVSCIIVFLHAIGAANDFTKNGTMVDVITWSLHLFVIAYILKTMVLVGAL